MKITTDIVLDTELGTYGNVSNITKFEQLETTILNTPYCLGTFKDNKLLKSNFIQCQSIALDFDGGYKLKDALLDLQSFQCIISTTKSHQKLKNGKTDDRFRVILFFTEPITDNDTFLGTFRKLQTKFPMVDKQCSNSNRWFHPSTKIIKSNTKGRKVKPEKLVINKPVEATMPVLATKGKGKLLKSTRLMLKNGIESGSRNSETFKIAKDFQTNEYTEDEAIEYITKAFKANGTLAYDFTEFEVENTIRSAYSSESGNAPRKPFRLISFKDVHSTEVKLEWVVENLLSVGGVSLISAAPKTGKSLISRQIIKNILHNEKFFGRNTKFGEVHYYAMEEQIEVINLSFKKLGLRADAPLYIHTGEVYSKDTLRDLNTILMERKPVLAVVDTLFDFLDVTNENSYKEVKTQLRKLRQVARNSGTHLLCVHHSNKGYGGVTGNHKSVLGSQAIVGGVDVIIVIELDGDTRVITTMGRSIKRWVTRELIWDENNEIYTLGGKAKLDEW